GWEGGASFSQGVFSFYIRDAEVAEVILILHFAERAKCKTIVWQNVWKFNMLLGPFPRIPLSGILGKIQSLC
ncbi:hypothetical protein D3OALGB2SA_2792, partial [Olavius algarvensis associated proteobacterium Delta 3]